MNAEKTYLTFPTDKGTAHLLTELAHINGMTQPELLDTICREYIEKKATEMITILNKHGISLEMEK